VEWIFVKRADRVGLVGVEELAQGRGSAVDSMFVGVVEEELLFTPNSASE